MIAEGEANRQSALDNGILNRAENNARMAIVKILELGKFGPVVFGAPLAGPPGLRPAAGSSPVEPAEAGNADDS